MFRVFGSYLYAGTSHNGKVYRSSNGTDWTEVANFSGQRRVYQLKEWNGYLYTVTMSLDGTTRTDISFSDTNQRTISTGGGDFVADGFEAGQKIRVSGSTSNDGIYTIDSVTTSTITMIAGDTLVAESEGASITIAVYGRIFRSSNGTTWTEVADFGLTAMRGRCLEIFGDYLYAGTALDEKIFRTNNGTSWTEVFDIGVRTVFTLKAFSGDLYAGANRARLFRTSNGTNWSLIGDWPGDELRSQEAFKGSLYVFSGSTVDSIEIGRAHV